MAEAITQFLAMAITREARALARAGRDIAMLQIGQPGKPPPQPVREAMREVLRSGEPGYTEALGLPALRERIAAFYGDRYGVHVAPHQVVVTTGSSGAFILSFLAALERGDRVGLGTPWYPAYPNILRALGLVPIPIQTDVPDKLMLSAKSVAEHDDLKGFIFANPANPTGGMLAAGGLAALQRALPQHAVLFSDEIYHGLAWGEVAATLVGHENVFVINSFSKYFAMPGMRVGWLVAPDWAIPKIEALAQNLFISPPGLSQLGALAAFAATDELDARAADYRRHGELLFDGLTALGVDVPLRPEGAFYLYANISAHGLDSMEFCERLLHEAGVAATPGHDFDPVRGRHWVRFSYACEEDEIHKALERLARFVAR